MKKTVFLLAIVVLLGACRKNDSGQGIPVLSKILVNGVMETEFIYNNKGQVTEVRSYDPQGSVAVLKNWSSFQYDGSGAATGVLAYSAQTNKPTSRQEYVYDAQGRISRISYYFMNGADSGLLSTHIDHSYDAQNRVIRQTWRDKEEKETTYRALTYYPDGQLHKSEVYVVDNSSEYLWMGTVYGAATSTVPRSVLSRVPWTVNFTYAHLVASSVTYYQYQQDGQVISNEDREEISNGQQNPNGLPKERTITWKKIKPAGADEVRTEQYEYITL